MRTYFTKLLTISSIAMLLSSQVFAEDKTYTLDDAHSYVLWHINHLGFSTQSGKWMANGTLQLDKEHMDKSKVNVTIDVAKNITGNPELEKHLAGELFFNATQFPTATFVSNKVTVTGKKTAKVTGMLTLHGVTKPVVLNVIFNAAGKNPVTDKDTVGFSATANIKRSDFGINGFLPKVGDEVKLDIQAEAYSAS